MFAMIRKTDFLIINSVLVSANGINEFFFHRFYEMIQSYCTMNQEEAAIAYESFKIGSFKRETNILQAQDIEESFYFIIEGGARKVKQINKKKFTIQFAFPGQFIQSETSYNYKSPSEFSIETFNECRAFVLQRRTIEGLLGKVNWINQLLNKIHAERIVELERQFMFRNIQNSYERFLELMRTYPRILFQGIPHAYLASYIGMSPEQFSRSKKIFLEVSNKSMEMDS